MKAGYKTAVATRENTAPGVLVWVSIDMRSPCRTAQRGRLHSEWKGNFDCGVSRLLQATPRSMERRRPISGVAKTTGKADTNAGRRPDFVFDLLLRFRFSSSSASSGASKSCPSNGTSSWPALAREFIERNLLQRAARRHQVPASRVALFQPAAAQLHCRRKSRVPRLNQKSASGRALSVSLQTGAKIPALSGKNRFPSHLEGIGPGTSAESGMLSSPSDPS